MWNNLEFFRRNFVIKFSKGIFQTSLLLQFLRDQESGFVTILIRTRILPLYTIVVSVPHLIASANWVLGELGSCLPEEISADVYSQLLMALVMP
ncbi:unnamed protein product [Lathyrus sativus]|nr:unnamed protein product [Lathyrus sativus]